MVRASEADFSGILGETMALIGDNSRTVLIFVVVLGGLWTTGSLLGLIGEGNTLLGFDFGVRIDETDTLASGLFELISAVVSIIASYLLAQALLAERGRLRTGGTRIWAYVGMSILSVLGIVFGIVLLIVPGVILLVRWSAATGYLIGERAGVVDSLTQSWHATRGHGWPIFFAGLVLFVGFLVAAGIVGGIAEIRGSEPLIAVLSGLAEAIGSAFSVAFGIAVYLLVSDGAQEFKEVFA